MRDLREFWREQDHTPEPFEVAVRKAQDTLNVEAWKGLLTAVEGLLLHRTMQYMAKGAVEPLDLDECQSALRATSLGYLQPTAPLERPRRRRSAVTEAAPSNAWGPRELTAIMALSVTGLTPENIAPGSGSALRVLGLLRAGLAAARARRSKAKAGTPTRNAARRAPTVLPPA